MTFIHSIILGIVEGITEFLPISSTGHMILASKLLHLADSEFLKSFEIFIQLGAILAVVVYYKDTVFNFKSLEKWKKVIAAFIPTGVIGLILYKLIKQYLLGNAMVVVWALIIGGIILIAFELWQSKREDKAAYNSIEEIPYVTAALLGVAQALAVIPGVSGPAQLLLRDELSLFLKNYNRFSFLLAIPTMLAASGLDLLKSGWSFTGYEIALLLVGFATTFFVALGVIKWLLSYLVKHSFIAFGVYRIIIGFLFFWLLF